MPKPPELPVDVLIAVEDMSPSQRMFFEQMLEDGQAPRMASMLAMRKPPGSVTEGDYMNGLETRKLFDNNPKLRERMVKRTRKEDPSFNPHGRVFMPQLVGVGKMSECWAPEHEIRSHLLAVHKKYNRGCSGSVNYKPHEVDPGDETYRVAQGLVDKKASQLMAQSPNLRLAEARDQARELITPKGLKKGKQGKLPKGESDGAD